MRGEGDAISCKLGLDVGEGAAIGIAPRCVEGLRDHVQGELDDLHIEIEQ